MCRFIIVVLAVMQTLVAAVFETSADDRKPAVHYFSFSLLHSDQPVFGERFSIGDVDLGQDVHVQMHLKNRSQNEIKISVSPSVDKAIRLLGTYKPVMPGEAVLVEAMIQVPTVASSPDQLFFLPLAMRDGVEFRASFKARIRSIVTFKDSIFVHTVSNLDGVPVSNPKAAEKFEIPLIMSDVADLERVELEADSGLSKIRFSRHLATGKILGEVSTSDLELKGCIGKLRLKLDGRIKSEATIKIVRKSDFQIFPETLFLKYDSKSKEYTGQMIIKSGLSGNVMQGVTITPQLVDETREVYATLGTMSEGISRIYVRVPTSVSKELDDLILFRIECQSQSKVEEQVFKVLVVN